jgi:PAS domain S-box-containing protein
MSDKVFRLLLLDEDEKDYWLILDLLSRIKTSEFKIDWVKSKPEGLKAIANSQYNAYLIECQSLIETIISQVTPAPVILLVDNIESGIRALQIGAADYLDKNHLSTPLLEKSLRLTITRAEEIKQRIKLEQKLQLTKKESQQSSNFLHTIIDHLPLAIFVKKAEKKDFGVLKLWNTSCETIFGLTSSQAIGKTVYEVFDLEEATFFAQKDKETLEQGSIEYISERIIGLDKKIFRTVKVPIYDKNLKPDYLLCFSEDITSRQQAEEQLQYRLALETALADISREFATNETINLSQILQLLRVGVGASRAYFIKFEGENPQNSKIYYWSDSSTDSNTQKGQNLDLSSFPWWWEKLKHKENIISRVDDLPLAATAEKNYLKSLNVNSVLAVPIYTQLGELWGQIGFESIGNNCKVWSEIDAQLLQVVSEIIYSYYQRQQAKTQLCHSNALYEGIFNHSTDGIFLIDVLPNGKFVYETINPSYQMATGIKSEEIAGKTPSEVLPPEIASMGERFYRACINSGKPISYEQTLEILGNNRIWRTRIIPIKDSTGKIVKLQGNSKDITEEKHSAAEIIRFTRHQQLLASLSLKIRQSWQIEEILQTAVTEIQKTLQAERVLFFRLFADGSGKAVNEAVVSGFPIMLNEVITEGVFQKKYQKKHKARNIHVCPDVLNRKFEPCYLEFFQKYRIRANLIVPIVVSPISNGKNINSFSSTPVSATEQVWGLLCVHQCSQPRDWTNEEIELIKQLADQLSIAIYQAELLQHQEAQRQELARSNAELESFAYVASHDLKAPLGTINGYARLLESRYQDRLDAKAKKYINYIIEEAWRMQKQIDDLLEYSRIGREKKPFEVIDCNVVFKQAIANLQLVIRKHQAVIISQDLPQIMADPYQLLQLFQNLIDNAIKYRRNDPPVVVVRAERQENGWLFCVKDNGIGIEPEYSQRIFKIFQRLHTQDEYPGTGIGLAICQKIVERHGGKIWVDSHPNQGSTFYFTFSELVESTVMETSKVIK